jgi:CRISPR type I-E-associated protein CasB/Cse2
VTDTATAPPAAERRERHALVASLDRLMTSRQTGELSTLRRCLGPLPRVPDARLWPLVIPYVGENDAARESGALLACLFATWHTGYSGPVHGTNNLGGALRRAVDRDKLQQTYNQLACVSWAGLPRTLAPLITQCSRANQPIDWDRLQSDLLAWRRGYQARVLKRWAAAMFNPAMHTISAPTAKEVA